MTLRFESTKKFENDLKRFPSKEKEKIVLKLNQYCQLLEDKSENFYKKAFQPAKLILSNDNESSLYALRIDQDIRIIMTVDDDPIFDQILITLLHLGKHSDLDKAYIGIAKSLYQNELLSINDKGKNNGSN